MGRIEFRGLAGGEDYQLRRLITEVMCECNRLGRTTIEVDKFIAELSKCGFSGNKKDTLEVLTFWLKLEEEQKEEVLLNSTQPYISITERIHLFSEEINKNEDSILNYIPTEEYDVDTLKHRIKYAKNPMEKQRLQRELNNTMFMSGKHRNSKKRR